MALKVLLAATLRKYIADYDAATGYALEVEHGASVRDVAVSLGIPEEEIKIIMVNGIGSKLETILQGNERVAFFPPVGGG